MCIHEPKVGSFSNILFASELFGAVPESFSKVHPDKEVPNKIEMYELVIKFRKQEVFVCVKYSLSDKIIDIMVALIQAVHQLQQWCTTAIIQYCNCFGSFVHEGIHVY